VTSTAESDGGTVVFRLLPSGQTTSGLPTRERISSVLWLPDTRHILVASQTGDPGSAGVVRTRLVLVDAGPSGAERQDAAPIDLAIVPADVLLDTASWSPDGRSIAVLAVTSAAQGSKKELTLDALDLTRQTGGFQYLADLGTEDRSSSSPPVTPVAWEPCRSDTCSASERLAYTASVPGQKGGGPLGLLSLVTTPTAIPGGLFVIRPSSPGPLVQDTPRLGSVTGLLGLAWRSSGTGTEGAPLLGLVRSSRGALSLRAIDPASGGLEDVGIELPGDLAPSATVIGVRWDLAHERGLVLARPTERQAWVEPPALDAWLLDFGSDKERVP
jgi:hypothetical protein